MSLEIVEKLQMDIERRMIYITEEIDKSVKARLSLSLSFLEGYEGDINLYINSPGGCLVSALAMYDLIKGTKNTVNGYVVGEACSAASLILQACDNRYITKHSSVMVHYGTHGLPSDVPKNNELLLNYYHSVQKDMIQIYKAKMKLKKKEMDDIFSYDTYFRAKEAIKLNLVDKIKNPSFESYEYDDGKSQEVSDQELDLIIKQLGIE